MNSDDNTKQNNNEKNPIEEERFEIDDSSLEDLNLSAEKVSPNDELEKQKKEYLYLRAEFDNFRKQSIKERSDLVRFGAERIARDLLPVIDFMDQAMAINVTPETLESYTAGINLTAKELTKTLEKHGIKELDCKNKPFNPVNSEALSQVPSTDVIDGNVLEVMRKGYSYHDKVLRPAQVVIASAPKEDS